MIAVKWAGSGSGIKRDSPESHCCGNHTRSRIKSWQFFPALSRRWELFSGGDCITLPRRRTAWSFFPVPCDPWAGARVSSCFRSIWDWLLVKPVFSSLLLRASAWLALRHGWWGLTLSPLRLQICPSALASMAESVDCLGPSWELCVTKAFLSLIRYSAVPFPSGFLSIQKAETHVFHCNVFLLIPRNESEAA